MNQRDAFRMGFLLKLAEEGISPSDFEKQAAGGGVLDAVLNLGKGFLNTGYGLSSEGLKLMAKMSPYALLLGLGIPVVGGVGTGLIHAGMSDTTEDDVETVKKQQMINQYQDEIARIRERTARHRLGAQV